MKQRKRFIAGVVCPVCRTQDTLALWHENSGDVVQCVKCGYLMSEADKAAHDKARVIKIFDPD